MDDVTRALLGDHEAAERLTERGELIPFPSCKNREVRILYAKRLWWDYWVSCPICGFYGPVKESEIKARKAWNTRAPLLTAAQMEALERMEDVK